MLPKHSVLITTLTAVYRLIRLWATEDQGVNICTRSSQNINLVDQRRSREMLVEWKWIWLAHCHRRHSKCIWNGPHASHFPGNVRCGSHQLPAVYCFYYVFLILLNLVSPPHSFPRPFPCLIKRKCLNPFGFDLDLFSIWKLIILNTTYYMDSFLIHLRCILNFYFIHINNVISFGNTLFYPIVPLSLRFSYCHFIIHTWLFSP